VPDVSALWGADVSDFDLYDAATALPESPTEPLPSQGLDMLGATLREAARRFGNLPAYVTTGGWSVSYTELDRVSDDVAAGLARRGLAEGDVLGLVLPPGPEYLVAYLAAAKLGAVTAGVNDRLTAGERAAVLDIASPRLVVARPDLAADRAAGDHEVVEAPDATSVDDLLVTLRASGDALPPLPDDPERPVAIIFTSGTTGTPKGALYCNRQLSFITHNDVGETWGGGGRSFSGTSFAHLGFMTKLPGSLRRGGTTFIMTRWTARGALELLARERMTSVAGVPAQLALMLRDPDFDTFDLTSVVAIVVGGGPVTPGLADEARARFHARLSTRYSCTEAGIGLGTAFDDPDEDAVVSVGRPHAAVELRILDEHDVEVVPGEVGAVCLRSPAVMSGYWRDPDATAGAFTADGFVRTGDLGWLDDRGRLRLVGRSKEMYVRGGYNVYPVEVEDVLSTHPGIAAVAVVPRDDDVMGEVGIACVVPRDPAAPPDLAALRAFARERLAGYKLPDELHVVESLPLTAMEKVDRRALAASLEPGGDARH
jgi:acyl-CoA synthetase (AMP-forming)/AMP-acid ligase II